MILPDRDTSLYLLCTYIGTIPHTSIMYNTSGKRARSTNPTTTRPTRTSQNIPYNHIITKTKTTTATTTVSVGPAPSPVTKGARRRKTISFTATATLRQFIGEEEAAGRRATRPIDPISRRGPPWLFFLGDWAESDRNLPLPAASESEERLGALCERRGPVRVGSDLSSVLVAPQSLAKMEMLMPRHHPSKLSS